jgi:hypothetical protein
MKTFVVVFNLVLNSISIVSKNMLRDPTNRQQDSFLNNTI